MTVEAPCFERRKGWGERIRLRVAKLRLPAASSVVATPLSEDQKKKDLNYSDLGLELAREGLGGMPTLIQMLDRAPTQSDRLMMLKFYSRGVAVQQLGFEIDEQKGFSSEEEGLIKFSSEEIVNFIEDRIKERRR